MSLAPLSKERGREFAPILYDYIDTSDGNLTIVKQQDVEPILDAVRFMPEMMTSRRKLANSGIKYVGSVPTILCLQWAKESGTRLFSKEWREVVIRKLHDPEFAKLKVKYT